LKNDFLKIVKKNLMAVLIFQTAISSDFFAKFFLLLQVWYLIDGLRMVIQKKWVLKTRKLTPEALKLL